MKQLYVARHHDWNTFKRRCRLERASMVIWLNTYIMPRMWNPCDDTMFYCIHRAYLFISNETNDQQTHNRCYVCEFVVSDTPLTEKDFPAIRADGVSIALAPFTEDSPCPKIYNYQYAKQGGSENTCLLS